MRTKSGPRSGRGGRGVGRQNGLKVAAPRAASPEQLGVDLHSDVSQQQPPIPTSVRSMRDLCRLMETATEEVREYLTEEFSIMYECKTCYSIFRSLANLISHKRFYCTTRYINRPRPADRDFVLEQLTQMVIPTEPAAGAGSEEHWHLGEDGRGDCGEADADARPWAASVGTSVPPIGAGRTRDAGGAPLLARSAGPDAREISVHLERLTKNAVYQTVSYEGTLGDLMSDQVAEVQSLNIDSQVTLGPDGKVLSEQPHKSPEAVDEEVAPKTGARRPAKDELQTTGSQYYVCGICNSICSTRKTLAYHMQYMHSKYRMCYPCLCCKSTFSKIWNVTRHLCKVHHKSTHQVNKLREIIQKKAFKKPLKDIKNAKVIKVKPEGTAQPEPVSKLSRQQQLLHENQIFMENVDGISKTQVCVACGTKFERQAALYSHLQRCPSQLRQLKLQTTADGDADAGVTPTAEAEVGKGNARLCDVTAATETDDDYDEDDQRVSRMLSDVPPIASHVSFTPKPADPVVVDLEEVPQQVAVDRGRSEKIQLVNPYRCGSERDSSTEKKIKIEVRKDYVKSVGSSAKNAMCSALTDDFSEVASPMSAMCYRGENSDSEDGGKASICAAEDQCNQVDVLEVIGVGYDDKEHASGCQTEPEGAHRRFLFSREMVIGSPKMISVLKKSHDLNSGICFDAANQDTFPVENDVDVKPEVNLSTVFPRNKTTFSPHMQKKMESLINSNKLQCLTCRKKFKKMANLRRHVALHIDWYRYRCTVCFFRCFAKYDCVAHVIKAHLKGGDRIQASGLVELLQNQEPDTQASSASEGSVDIGESNGTVDTVQSELMVVESKIKDVGSTCLKMLLQERDSFVCVPEESGLSNLDTSCQGTSSVNAISSSIDPHYFGECIGAKEKTSNLEELNLKCNEKSLSSTADVNCTRHSSQIKSKTSLLDNDMDVIFEKHMSEKNNLPQGDKMCSWLVDGKLCTSESYCNVNTQSNAEMSVNKDLISPVGAAERDGSNPEILIDYKNNDTRVNGSPEKAPIVREQTIMPVADCSLGTISSPAQDVAESSLLVKSSTEKLISPTKHIVVDINSPEKEVDEKQTNVHKVNSSLRCTIDKQAALRKVIDKIASHGKEIKTRNVGSGTNRREDSSETRTESVLLEPDGRDCGTSSVVAQADSNSSVMNHEEDMCAVPGVLVKTEVEPEITIEYEGKSPSVASRAGGFLPRRRRGRIGSDSSMICEPDETRSSFMQSCPLPDGHFPQKKRKRSKSESRGWVRQRANSFLGSNRSAEADTANDASSAATAWNAVISLSSDRYPSRKRAR
ncbi:uncharacterized protein LOC134543096 isoform X2 [Bacillus rossius redtenbacheri]|uniref:uncharacterized protein LOC134543096 isoform X2 n=1 Tax=Bacillus rossius redtenbacheri TaxID=93214 RepID=UPI002FDD52AD